MLLKFEGLIFFISDFFHIDLHELFKQVFDRKYNKSKSNKVWYNWTYLAKVLSTMIVLLKAAKRLSSLL